MLNLGYSKVCVTDNALARLSGLTKLKSLHIGSMQLCNTYVTDAGIQLIAKHFRGLTQLGLMSLDISDAGVQQLAGLKDLQVGAVTGCSVGQGMAGQGRGAACQCVKAPPHPKQGDRVIMHVDCLGHE